MLPASAQPLLRLRPGCSRASTAIFLSGGGSNAEKLLQALRALSAPPLVVQALVTDAPETSRARELGKIYQLPVIESDIREFYRQHGESKVSIATPRGQELRNQWTDDLRQRLAPFQLDFAIFAGFVPLTNLTRDLPCLNVHPGDLTYLVDGRRHLVGLHTTPIERAILAGLDHLRTSVILAQEYSGSGDDMDNGPILGLSAPVAIDWQGHALTELQEIAHQRSLIRPRGGYQDDLATMAANNQELLKQSGDWIVLPPVVIDYAEQRFAIERDRNQLYYRQGQNWLAVNTVVYHQNNTREPRLTN